MSALAQEIPSPLEQEPSQKEPSYRIEVAHALPRHAHAVQKIYQDGRVEAQPHGDLTAEHVIAEYRDPESTMEGQTTKQWEDMINGLGGNAVFASFTVEEPEKRIKKRGEDVPQGIVRASEVNGELYLKNLYVKSDERGKGHGVALFRSVQAKFGGREFKILVAAHNDAMDFYSKLGCIVTGEHRYEMQGVMVRQIEMTSPSVK